MTDIIVRFDTYLEVVSGAPAGSAEAVLGQVRSGPPCLPAAQPVTGESLRSPSMHAHGRGPHRSAALAGTADQSPCARHWRREVFVVCIQQRLPCAFSLSVHKQSTWSAPPLGSHLAVPCSVTVQEFRQVLQQPPLTSMNAWQWPWTQRSCPSCDKESSPLHSHCKSDLVKWNDCAGQ